MSCNDNQNHLVRKGRTTSRVLAPPGGKTSFSLGMDDAPVLKKKEAKPQEREASKPAGDENNAKLEMEPETKEAQETKEVVEKDDDPEVEAVPGSPPKQDTCTAPKSSNDVQQQQRSTPVSANAFASGANMNGAQVMTGRPTSRVLAPPGGTTSWTL